MTGEAGEMLVAEKYRLTPTQWYAEPRWSRATMMAIDEVKGALEYWRIEDSK